MLLHAGVRFSGDQAEIPANQFTHDEGGRAAARQYMDSPRYSSIALSYTITGPGAEAVHGKTGEEIWEDYKKLAMRFPVRCKFASCSGNFVPLFTAESADCLPFLVASIRISWTCRSFSVKLS